MSIARNATYDYVSQFAVAFIGVIAGICLSRVFGSEGTGLYYAVTVVAVGYGTNFSNLGIRTANQYHVGKNPACASACHTWAILFALVCSAAAIGLAWLFQDVLFTHVLSDVSGAGRGLLIWSVLALPLSLYNYGWAGILIGLGRIRQLSLFNFFFYMSHAFAILIVLALKGDLRAVIAAWVAVWALGAVGMLFCLRDHPPALSLDLGLLRRTLSYGLRAFVGDFASNIMLGFSKLILMAQPGAAALLGVYMKADSYGMKAFAHNDALYKGAFHSVTATSRLDAARLTCRLVRNSLALGLFVWIAGGCAGSVLLVFNGPEFVAGIGPLWILMIGPWIIGGSRMIAMYYTGQRGRPQIPSLLAWAGALINIPLVIYGLRWGGLPGLAAACSLTFILHFGLYLLLFAREVRPMGFTLTDILLIQRGDIAHWREIAGRVRRKIPARRKAPRHG